MIYHSDNRVTIRDITDIEELRHLEQMQADVWGITDRSEIVPKDILKIIQVNGGLVLGAYDQNQQILGFLFGFLGIRADGQLKHCSHMMGILPKYRASGIGLRLKLAQRSFVLKQGINLITWTVNPLEGANAAINFGKLGVVCRNYLPNFYGEMEDSLNKGFPSHRFEVEWWIRSPRVEEFIRLAEGGNRIRHEITAQDIRMNQISTEGKIIELLSLNQIANQTGKLVYEVPMDFQGIKDNDLNIAKELLEHDRAFFMEAVAQGYVVADFMTQVVEGERRNYYLLERNLENILNRSFFG